MDHWNGLHSCHARLQCTKVAELSLTAIFGKEGSLTCTLAKLLHKSQETVNKSLAGQRLAATHCSIVALDLSSTSLKTSHLCDIEKKKKLRFELFSFSIIKFMLTFDISWQPSELTFFAFKKCFFFKV